MDKERFLQSGLLEQYVLGLTTDEENEEVERYARAFPDVQNEIDQLQKALKAYAEEQIATPRLKKMQPVPEEIPASGRLDTRPSQISAWLLAACVLLSLLFSFYQYTETRSTKARLSELNRTFSAFRSDCQIYQQSLHELETQLAFYQNEQTTPLYLQGTSLAPDLEVVVYWNEQKQQALLHVVSLPVLPQSKQYQVWADINGKMVNLGLIETQYEKPQPIRCFPDASSLNITLEPLGGSNEPHVDQLFANVNL